MTKENKGKGKETNPRYVQLLDDMTNSAAWTVLSDSAIWVYIELRKKFDFEKGGNERLILPFREVKWRMKDIPFAKRKRELIEFGFIDCVDPGGLMNRSAIYRLSDRWKKISRNLVSTRGREAIRSGLVKKPPSPKYREKSLKNIQRIQKKETEKKEDTSEDINIKKSAPQKGDWKRGPQSPQKGDCEAFSVSTKGGLTVSTKGGLSLKDKKKKETSLEDLTESELLARLQDGHLDARVELENRGFKVASMGIH